MNEHSAAVSLWSFSGLSWKEIVKRVWARAWKNQILDRSAVLSFYFLLSIFPLLLFLISILGIFLQSGPVFQQTLHSYLQTILPGSASDLINSTLHEVVQASSGGKLSFALLFTLWTASRGLLAIIVGLNIAYEVKESRPWFRQNLMALFLTIVIVGLISAALSLVIGGAKLNAVVGSMFVENTWIQMLWTIANWALVLLFILIAFNVLYIYAPNLERRHWHWFMPGTVVGVGLWLAVSLGFKLYLTFFNSYSVAYGSIGAVIILLLWFYCSGAAILVGAEVNCELDRAARSARERGQNYNP